MALVEVGPSAGLNLLWDRYRICYSDGSVFGDTVSSIQIECENRGASLPAEDDARPTIVDRVGVDLHPIDLNDSDERLWLRALVWPDHRQRADRLEAAISLASRMAPKIIRGDALAELPGMLANVPRRWTLCVYHSSVLYQFTPDAKDRFVAILADASLNRPLWHLSAENEEGLRLFSCRNGKLADERLLGTFDAHGRWLSWGRGNLDVL